MSLKLSTLVRVVGAGCLVTVLAVAAQAQTPIRIGEINSYKAQPAFLEPYKKGRNHDHYLRKG